VVAGGCWGTPGGRLKISSLVGRIGETAALSHPTYTWEYGGNSCCEALTLAGEEEQHPSISETGTWHPSGPISGEEKTRWELLQHNCKCKTIAAVI